MIAATATATADSSGQQHESLKVCVVLSEGETMTGFARSPTARIYSAECSSSSPPPVAAAVDRAATIDRDVVMSISCGEPGGCTCTLGCEPRTPTRYH